MKRLICDINCDMGEGVSWEPQLAPYITSCSIACGGHTGDQASMRSTAELAMRHNIKIGAHPSYPDREHFGRKIMDIDPCVLRKSLSDQILSLQEVLQILGVNMHHIKPHGALYNMVAKDSTTAQLLLDVVSEIDRSIVIYAPFGSKLAGLATRNGFAVWYEAFADRVYTDELALVSRTKDNSMIPVSQVTDHVKSMIDEGHVVTETGKKLPIEVQTLCVHGDNPEAENILKALSKLAILA